MMKIPRPNGILAMKLAWHFGSQSISPFRSSTNQPLIGPMGMTMTMLNTLRPLRLVRRPASSVLLPQREASPARYAR
jgi:hypothetical protein